MGWSSITLFKSYKDYSDIDNVDITVDDIPVYISNPIFVSKAEGNRPRLIDKSYFRITLDYCTATHLLFYEV